MTGGSAAVIARTCSRRDVRFGNSCRLDGMQTRNPTSKVGFSRMMGRLSPRTPPLGRSAFTTMKRYPGSRLNLLSAPSQLKTRWMWCGNSPTSIFRQWHLAEFDADYSCGAAAGLPTLYTGLTAFPHRPITGRHRQRLAESNYFALLTTAVGIFYLTPRARVK